MKSEKSTGIMLSLLLASMFTVVFNVIPAKATPSGTILVAAGATWKYLDDGSDQGTAWREPAFVDAAWSAGPAELGYGDDPPDEATVVSYGPDPFNKYITTYFRHSFEVADASIFNILTLRILRDDGAVVYLNGAGAIRTNMPAGTITYTTLASSTVGGADEDAFYVFCVNPDLLVDGTNVLAVEIHQVSGTSSDISFNLELFGQTVFDLPEVTRGPYLQMGTPTSVVVRWRTDVCADSRVSYGADPGDLTMVVDDTAFTTEHEVPLTGLEPDTKYYYSIGTTTGTLAGGDEDHFFVTLPLEGTAKPTRVWVIGDSGTADANAQAVRDAYLSFTGSRSTDVWLMLGDNAYLFGTDDEYTAAVFDTYPMLLRNTVVWPAFGNHDDISSDSSTQSGPYFDSFTLPTNAEAGGLASGTEAYYSFDYGNIHFINLDSSTASSRLPGSAMLTWLEDDLAVTSQDWIIAYWHHAPYTKGSHDSDAEIELNQMRENVLPILEAVGVDLVLTGHSHSYERSFLIDSHYGTSDTLTDDMIIDSGNGRLDGDGAYSKPTLGQGSHEGAVYAVVGSSGLISGGPLNHPVMVNSLNELGSMVLDVNGSQLDAKFIDNNGITPHILDYFTIVKGRPSARITVDKPYPQVYHFGETMHITIELENPLPEPKGVILAWFAWLYPPSGPWIPLVMTPYAIPADTVQMLDIDIPCNWGSPIWAYWIVAIADLSTMDLISLDAVLWSYTPT
ncbi:MAG: metallophosphoesterase [Bacteroidota bacterium]